MTFTSNSFMVEVLTLEEMKSRYHGEWLLVDCQEMDDDMNVVRGKVVAHFSEQAALYEAIADYRTNHNKGTLAIEYVGEIPEDWAVLL
jgi:hypothetical protein